MRTKAALEVEGRTLQVSNLEKVMFPAVGFTKAQVIDYYIRAARFILPHLKERPLTLKRYPDGIAGPHFYEKDAPSHTPQWVTRFGVARKGGGSKIDYVLVNDLPTLVWSANLANLEMHTFLARVPRIGCPSMMVFDLDPGEPADILQAAEVAFWLKQLLERFKLKSFVKVSGSKGLHLHVPLNTPTRYEVTRPFARALADSVVRQHPDEAVAEMAKQRRRGKVFIDWSQNDDYKSTVCVYSLRAKRERPFVALPVSWEELRQALERRQSDSLFFEPEAALRRAEERDDLFAPVLTCNQRLPDDVTAVLRGDKAPAEVIRAS